MQGLTKAAYARLAKIGQSDPGYAPEEEKSVIGDLIHSGTLNRTIYVTDWTGAEVNYQLGKGMSWEVFSTGEERDLGGYHDEPVYTLTGPDLRFRAGKPTIQINQDDLDKLVEKSS